jgi:hypothetical protein
MTDAIGPLSRTLELLRRQMAEHARQLESGSRTTPGGSAGTTSRSSAGKLDINALRQKVSERLEAIDATDPNAQRRRRRVFLESVLAWEFGEEALRDPGFQDLVDRLEESFATHPEVERQFRAAFGD